MEDKHRLAETNSPAEFGVLARQMGQAYAKTASFYRDQLGKDPDDR